MRSRQRQLIELAGVASLAGLNNGWSLKVGGFVLSRLDEASQTDVDGILIGSAILVGAIVGALGSGLMIAQFGIRGSAIVGESIVITGTLVGVAAPNRPALIVWRLISGLGVGLCITAKPIFIVATSEPAYRGRLLALMTAMFAIAFALAEAADWMLPEPHDGDESWRALIAMGLPAPMLLCCLMATLSEPASPSSAKGTMGESTPLQAESTKVQTSLEDPKSATGSSSSSSSMSSGGGGGDGESGSDSAPPSIAYGPLGLSGMMATLVLAKEIIGGNILLVYAFDYLDHGLLQEAAAGGEGGDDADVSQRSRATAHLAGLVVAGVFVVSGAAGVALVDHPSGGRRLLAIGGTAGSALACLLISIAFWMRDGGSTDGGAAAARLLPIALVLHACTSTFVQVAFYPLTTELMPPRLRSSWLGVVYAAAQAIAFVMITIGGACEPSDAANGVLFLVLGLGSAACALVFSLWLVETRPPPPPPPPAMTG